MQPERDPETNPGANRGSWRHKARFGAAPGLGYRAEPLPAGATRRGGRRLRARAAPYPSTSVVVGWLRS